MTGEQKRFIFNEMTKNCSFDKHKYGPPFEPPWIAFPDYPRYSMGFRMGGGEDYMMAFRKWYFSAPDAEIKAFQISYPESEAYQGFYNKWDENKEKRVVK